MKLKLATKISLSILGVLGITLLSSAVALVCTWQIGQLFERTIAENLPSVRATEEMEIALLEQRGSVAAYILDGGKRVWLDELRQREPAFDHWLAQARSASNAPEEEEIVARILESNHRYESKRDEVITLYDRGEIERAKSLLLGEVNTLHDEVFKHCEEFIAANERFVTQAMERANTRINIGTWWVTGCTALTAILGTGLFGLFYYGVLRPLRTIVAEARLALPTAGNVAVESRYDELRTVGNYLQKLMLDAADARSTLLQSREQLMNAEKLVSVGKLAACVAHEIRNPLTAIKIWLFTIRKGAAADPRLDYKLEVVAAEIERLESIVRNFLEFSRPPDLRLHPRRLPELIDKTLELFGQRLVERGARLIRDDPDDLPPVLVDADQFKQMLMNLIENAAEAIPSGGQVKLSTKLESDDGGHPMAVLRLQDFGSGMSPETAARVFEPFFTTKEEGTGLGLCIAASIIARHHGRLVLESTSSGGTTMAVWLPLAPMEEHA